MTTVFPTRQRMIPRLLAAVLRHQMHDDGCPQRPVKALVALNRYITGTVGELADETLETLARHYGTSGMHLRCTRDSEPGQHISALWAAMCEQKPRLGRLGFQWRFYGDVPDLSDRLLGTQPAWMPMVAYPIVVAEEAAA